MIFVDTNYFLRFLIRDDEKHYLTARKLFEAGAMGKAKLFTCNLVIFELKWVLSSFYLKDKQEVIDILTNVLAMQFVDLAEKDMLMETVALFKNSTLEFEDCFNLFYAKSMEADSLATFDQKLNNKFKEMEKS
ncbi:hypothetical protein A3D03_03755 [Candidatus Gottesmanbacteria bacterium RIFCSPHIGHO2_02_FULL_40_13]|uniref:PIN domain-containing protein n=1 Tax=Candidatus Gottesmanbacteria bacterium RIFCSPHIGHO2_02_FULL_40_13 TaxID=1798384 RepID=A0A1F6ACC9_9BACT|nr:MAG: hypothetical protein A3D03_03755 [Candidatus Gottesmanbacteria bacterium RIFCSPHIGHO2_02_FULL_40_13]